MEERRKKQQAARAANKKNGGNGNAAGAGANGNDNDKHGHGHKRQQRRVSRVKFIRVKFSQNSANKGGAIWNDGSHTEVEDSFFWKNQVRFTLFVWFGVRLVCLYVYNQTHTQPHRPLNPPKKHTPHTTHHTPPQRQAHLGGAIFNAKHGRMLVRETAFVENEASAKGGAIFNDGWLWVVCSAFVDNQAPLGYVCGCFWWWWLLDDALASPITATSTRH